jgi:hypothetical protein
MGAYDAYVPRHSTTRTLTPIERTKQMAQDAVFHVQANGVYLRMQYCNDKDFSCVDEDTGEGYVIRYEDVDTESSDFYRLTKIVR